MSDSLRPHGLQPTRLLRPWHFPGKSLEWAAIAFSEEPHEEIVIPIIIALYVFQLGLFCVASVLAPNGACCPLSTAHPLPGPSRLPLLTSHETGDKHFHPEEIQKSALRV